MASIRGWELDQRAGPDILSKRAALATIGLSLAMRKRVVRKRKGKPEWLPWYRSRNYKGDMTETEKRQLDAFRAQPKHPATRTEDLPEEVRDYINGIELELYDHNPLTI